MWVRKRLEISAWDLVASLARCAWPGNAARLASRAASTWGDDALVLMSVRSGFDLLFETLRWPAGSEVILSALTIPDMPRIVREHGLRAVGVDVDYPSIAPNLDHLRRCITPRTKAIVVAHLFGGLCEMAPLVELARRHGLMLIEDCAQAYAGRDYQGDPRCDISMFSFGPIKTNTALAGGVFKIRDAALRSRLMDAHDHWPRQTRWSFAKRIVKYAFVRAISARAIAGLIALTARSLGRDHDALAVRLSRGFAGPGFFRRIRHQPAIPLLWLMARKFARFRDQRIRRRAETGLRMQQRLLPMFDVVGGQMLRPTFWVLPVLADRPQELVRALWRQGFDGTASSSLRLVGDGQTQTPASLPIADWILRHIVYLPFDDVIPEHELERLASVMLRTEFARPRTPAAVPLSSHGDGVATPSMNPTSR